MATPQQAASFTVKQGKQALLLYRNLMKLQLRKIPEELRTLGDLYIKQEFRLHLDKANEDQMKKFLVGWSQYEQMLAN
jgi:reverse gyrase